MVCSEFLNILDPAQRNLYEHLVDAIEAKGGRRKQANALEALLTATRSPFSFAPVRSSTHFHLRRFRLYGVSRTVLPEDPACAASPYYPVDAPQDLDEMFYYLSRGGPHARSCIRGDRSSLALLVPAKLQDWKSAFLEADAVDPVWPAMDRKIYGVWPIYTDSNDSFDHELATQLYSGIPMWGD